MTIKDEDDSGVAIFGPPSAPLTEPDRASESVMSTRVPESSSSAPGPVSSGAIELPRDSFHPSSIPEPPPYSVPPFSGGDMPPSTIVQNALGRGREQMPLSTIVAIAGGIVVVLILLSLLLFR